MGKRFCKVCQEDFETEFYTEVCSTECAVKRIKQLKKMREVMYMMHLEDSILPRLMAMGVLDFDGDRYSILEDNLKEEVEPRTVLATRRAW